MGFAHSVRLCLDLTERNFDQKHSLDQCDPVTITPNPHLVRYDTSCQSPLPNPKTSELRIRWLMCVIMTSVSWTHVAIGNHSNLEPYPRSRNLMRKRSQSNLHMTKATEFF